MKERFTSASLSASKHISATPTLKQQQTLPSLDPISLLSQEENILAIINMALWALAARKLRAKFNIQL